MAAPSESENRYKGLYQQEAQNYTPSQAAASTIYEPSAYMDDDSRTDVTGETSASRASLYSYHSHIDVVKFVKHVDGRTYNSQNDSYFFPTDSTEWVRLNKQHAIFLLGMSGLYPNPKVVQAALTPVEGETRRILDLGCGTGLWTIEMAKEFPHAEVVGVDLAPSLLEPEAVPPNCRFELDNINLGLKHFANRFDVVHMRLVGSGTKDFRKTMNDIEECLKPGGIVIYIDGDLDMYSEDQLTYREMASEEKPDGSWLQRCIHEMRKVAARAGSDFFGMAKALDEGLWDHDLIDPDTCATASLWVPMGPWAEIPTDMELTQRLKYAGSLLRQDSNELHRLFHPILRRGGFEQEVLEQWSKNAEEELGSLRNPIWLRFRIAWGRRRAAPSEPAPPLPPVPQSSSSDATQYSKPYPYLIVHSTRGEALRQTIRREKSKPEEVKTPPSPIAAPAPIPAAAPEPEPPAPETTAS